MVIIMSKLLSTQQLVTLNNMADDLKDNFDDPNKSNEILNDMLGVLGEKPMFESTEDFINFIKSGEPLVL